MSLAHQIRELAGKVEATRQQGQDVPGGTVADYDMLRDHIEARTGLRNLMHDNLPSLLSALELAERMDAPECVEVVATTLFTLRRRQQGTPYFGGQAEIDADWRVCKSIYLEQAPKVIAAMKGL